jgi:hypothetical protein
MTIHKEKNRTPIKHVLRTLSAVLLALSALPCLLAFMNIPSVIEFAIQTGGNAALQIYIPLGLAALINGIGVVILIVSFAGKEEPTPPPRFY